ncbi:hypothetical protein GGR51DRAFT_503594 [Nemania sp. FL0031]|nr:hypothetical protein GGR51DRAFT_503594 [Nemania sp. FL0031]
MKLYYPFHSISGKMATYDEIYVESWEEALKECRKRLEGDDRKRALQVKSLQDFRSELESLLKEYPNKPAMKAITLLYPTLEHYETFAQNFVAMMENPVDTSMMWGLLFLVLKLALGSVLRGQTGPLNRITKWLEKIGHKLRASNDCSGNITDFEKVKGDTVEVNKEIVILWLNVIMTFRNQGNGRDHDDGAWEALTKMYNEAYQTIDEAVGRIEKVAEMAERQARAMKEITMFQRILSLESKQDGANLPCNNLPVAENNRFFGRQDILRRLEDHLTPCDTHSRLSSIALYGLGGIGKTQIALAYAYQKLEALDAIFWISAEDSYSVQLSFSSIAVDALKLPNARAQAYQENMILVQNWLQNTAAKWLLIFDNVDSHDVLDNCWPVSKHGAILVTTRDEIVATLPIDTGLEVNEFGVNEGAEFLLHMAPRRRRIDGEEDAARQVASELGGLPLAINQMAALINARNCTITEFGTMYAKYEHRLHKQRKNGWKYLGYEHGLDTVWELSFENLGEEARACLGVLSFFAADLVPSEVFKTENPDELPESLRFCEDELSLGDALEELTHHALVRRNIDQGSFRIHRLVQREYQARIEDAQQQFEAATKLLLDKFPSQRANKYDDDEWIICERYIPQVLALTRNYEDSQSRTKPLKPSMDFVSLLANAANAIHDNDTTNDVPGFLETGTSAFLKCPEEDREELIWAFLQSMKAMYHLTTAEFAKSEVEMTEGLEIRLRLLDPEDLLISLGYSWLGMAVGGQGRFEEGLDLLLKAGKVLEGPAGEVPTRKLVWRYNTSRNYYCMGRYEEAEELLSAAVEEAEGWYQLAYGHLTFVSLRTRMNQLEDAKNHVDIAKNILETAGISARFSWVSSYCAYRAGVVAMLQGRIEDAIAETEKAVAIGKLVKVPTGILSRCTHAFSKALAMDASRQDESERQRLEARRLRLAMPTGGGDLDDESDEAFEKLVKMDHR